MSLVSLLTDFGLRDSYVGQMKAALLRVCANAQLVDLTHEVPPQDVRTGAFLLWTAVEAFAPGALHLAVVDPGVGTRRRAIALQSMRGDVLVGPDNGLLMPAAWALGGVRRAVALTETRYFGPTRSNTFHGRDLFAPVTGHLASGIPFQALGPDITDPVATIRFPRPRTEGASLLGEVLHADAYGNLVTNLPAGELPERFDVRVAHERLSGAPHADYQTVKPGALLALVGSAGLLEISVRDGNAAQTLGIGVGARVEVLPHQR